MRSASKSLRFPLGGLATDGSYRDTTYPTDGSVYFTPMASNVIGTCAIEGRTRGGSRPGLKPLTGVSSNSVSRWLWPNGEPVEWPDGLTMTFSTPDCETLSDGTRILSEHPTAAVYRGRLVKAEGVAWMASRTGDFADFDFGGEADDSTRAVAGVLANAEDTGESVTAVCPLGDSRLVIATKRRLAVCTGEPTAGFSTLSENVGIISANAWCNANGALFFMGTNGLYAAADGAPIRVSNKIPEELKGLSAATLVFDPDHRGIHLFTTGGGDWFYDIDAKAFWPMSYPNAKRPVAGGLALVGGVNTVVFRCADGAWRSWNDEQTTDDGTALASSVSIGPFKCGVNDDIDGLLAELNVTLAQGSSNVTLSIAVGKTAEQAEKASAQAVSFTVQGGFNTVIRPRVRGAWCRINLASSGRWAFEGLQIITKSLGRLRT